MYEIDGNNLFGFLYQEMPQGVLILGADGTIQSANPAASGILGVHQEHMLGKTFFDCVGEIALEDGRPFPGKTDFFTEGIRTDYPLKNLRVIIFHPLTKSPVWLNLNFSQQIDPSSRRPLQTLIFLEDITQPQKTLVEIRTAYQQTEEILESITDPFYFLDQDYRFAYINQKAASLWKKDRSELLGKILWEEFPNAKSTDFYAYIQQVTDKRTLFVYETYSEYIKQWIEVHIYPTAHGFAVYFQNITERKQAEKEISRLNRLYASLLKIGQTIVRIGTNEELFQSLCQLANDFGEKSLAWVALYDGESEELKTVASNGPMPEQGLIMQTSAYGISVVGMAIQSKKLVVCNDFPNDPRVSVGQDLFAEQDYRSLAAIPLLMEGKVMGIFCLLSTDANVYQSEKEIALLEEIGRDVSFALEKIHSDKIQRQWSDAFEHCAHGIAIGLPSANRMLTCNPAFARLQGYTIEEISRMPILSMYAPEDRGRVMEWIAEADRLGFVQYEARMLRKDGSQYAVLMDVVSVKDERGNLLYRVATQQDITARIQSEWENSRLLERLNLATRASLIGIWDWDIVHNQLNWDDQMYRTHGIQKVDFSHTFDGWVQMLHPADLEATQKAVLQTLHGERDYDIEYRILWPDGSVHWLKAIGEVFCDSSKTPLRMVGVNYEITNRKQIEEKLRERNHFIEAILENAPVGFSVNRISDGRAIFTSSKFFSIYGLPARGFHDRDDFFENVYLDPVYREQMRERVIADLNSGDPARMHWENIPITTLSGDRIFVSATNFPLPEQDMMISTVRDVTKEALAEEEIRKLNLELEKRVTERTAQYEAAHQEIESFSYSVSHDLRAPLRAMDGYSRILMEDYSGQLDDHGRNYLTRIHEAALRMGQLIEDILKLSRLSRSEVVFQDVDLTNIAQELVNSLQAQNPEREVEFHVAEGMFTRGDRNLLKIALDNLLNNAYKFSFNSHPARIEFGFMKQSGKTIYFVRDNGAGFDMNYAGKLFTPFQRLHNPTEFAGNGIGLVIIRRIVEMHGGRIWAEAEPGNGATFFFSLGWK